MPSVPRRIALAVMTCVPVAGCQPAPGPAASVTTPAQAIQQAPEAERKIVMPQDVSLGTSVRGQSIAMTVFQGEPGGAVLVIGGVHGDEPTGVDVARSLLAELRADPAPAGGRTVAILANANPDGYAAGTRRNANDIDVNRNFPAGNFKRSWRRGGGREPASEPETRAIIAAIERLRPALIISIHAMDGGRQCNNYDGPAEAVAKTMARHNGYPATPTIGYPTPGSLGSYAGADQQIPTITLELPRALSGAKAWAGNRAALLAAIRGDS